MVFIRTDENNKVTMYHENPDVLSEEDKVGGIIVDNIPEVEQRVGKSGVLMYQEPTNTVYVKYEDRPLREDEKMTKMQNDMDYLILKAEGLI